MLEKYEVCCSLFHGFDWSKWTTGTSQERLTLLPILWTIVPRVISLR